MNNPSLTSYEDLLEFLTLLRDQLNLVGLQYESALIERASRFYGGSSTEFMGESRIALRAIRSPALGHLDSDWIDRIDSVIKQIDTAFKAVGS